MKRRKRSCHLAQGIIAATGLVVAAAAVSVEGALPTDRDLASQVNKRLTKGRVVSVDAPLAETAVVPHSLFRGFDTFDADAMDLVETMPPGLPIVTIEIPNDEAIASGRVALGSVEAYVFCQPNDSGSGYLLKSSDDTAGLGAWANQMIFGNGFEVGGEITGYDLLVYVSYWTEGPTSFEVQLWDGDPNAVMDTVCSAGGVPAPIPGTAVTFSDLPPAEEYCPPVPGGVEPRCVGLYRLRATLPAPVTIDCDRVWMVTTMTEGCRATWRIAGSGGEAWNEPAAIGWADGFWMLYACEQFGWCSTDSGYAAGLCCDTGNPCDHTDADPGNWTGDCGHHSFCGDETAEHYFAWSDEAPVYYNSLVGSVYAATDMAFSLVPVSSSDPVASIVGNEITLEAGHTVTLEIEVMGWDPDLDGSPKLKAWQAEIDSAGYSTGLQGTLTPWRPSCTVDADCEALMGPLGTGGARGGCGISGVPPGYCTPGFIDNTRTDYVLGPCCPCLDAIDLTPLNYRYGATCNTTNCVTDPGIPQYGGTLFLEVPPDAGGTFTVGFTADLTRNGMLDENSISIPLLGLKPAEITVVELVACCLPTADCILTTPADCETQNGTLVSACLGDDDDNGQDDACEYCCVRQPGRSGWPGECLSATNAASCVAQDGLAVPACLGDNDGTGGDDACETRVPAGLDCYQTESGLTVFNFDKDPIPAGFFFEQPEPPVVSEPFAESVSARGSGQSECLHGYDTVIGRLDDMVFDDIEYPSTQETAMELVCLDLESCEPIEVQIAGEPTYWNVGIELSSVAAPNGTLRATKMHLNGGTFRMEYSAQLKYTFSSVADAGDVRIFDTGKEGRDPIQLGTLDKVPWVHQPTISVFTCGENFTPGINEQPPSGAVATGLPDTQCCNKDSSSGPEGTHQTGPTDCSACPAGACCLEDGSCVVAEPTGEQVAKQVCEDDLGGRYTADYTDCTDTDGDEIADVFETNNIVDAQAPELWATGTLASAKDTDGDGCGDKWELNNGFNGNNPCDPGDDEGEQVGCPPFDDNNQNNIPDPCDVQEGRDCDGGGISADSNSPDHKGACCNGLSACGETTKPDCEANGFDFRGLCTKCPGQGGDTAKHGGLIVRHWPSSMGPMPVCQGRRLRSNGCIEGDLIDAWKTDPTKQMCHEFGGEATPHGSPPIPADFFEPGSEPFEGSVCLEGVPLGGEFPQADTLIRRWDDPFDRCVLPSTIEVPVDAEITALSLRSKTPITVVVNGSDTQWDATVDLSPTGTPPLGEVRAIKIHCNGGTYTSILHAYPRFTFTKVGVPEPPVRVLDTADPPPGSEYSYVTLYQVGADAEEWVSDLDPGVETLSPYCTDFHPAIEPTETKRRELRQIPCDCNDNGIRDKCDIEGDTSQDCNENRMPDECEVPNSTGCPEGSCAGTCSEDCNENCIPDECEVDCNHNMVPDDCDIAGDTSQDCQPNDIPDECEDCNDNGVGDSCDIAGVTSDDCNENGVPDDCERDCNANGVADGCDIAGPTSEDVDENGLPDECDCLLSTAPEPDRLALAGEPINQKMRYLSFTAGNAGRQQAVRIRFHNLPPPYNAWNGVKMWVQEPTEFCENAGKVVPPCPGGAPHNTWLGAALGCEPWFGDFYLLTQDDAIHVFHEGIIPGGTYVIQVVEDGCPLNLATSYSDPLTMTMSRWGDLIRNCITCPCTPPDGVVGIPTDVTAVLDKFKNLGPPMLPCYAPVKVRADHDWCTPNRRIDISDVTFCLDAFRGVQYPPPAFSDCMTLPAPPCQ